MSITSSHRSRSCRSTVVVSVSSQFLGFLSYSSHGTDKNLVLIKEWQNRLASSALNLLQLGKGHSPGGCLKWGLSQRMFQCDGTSTPSNNAEACICVAVLLTCPHRSKALSLAFSLVWKEALETDSSSCFVDSYGFWWVSLTNSRTKAR